MWAVGEYKVNDKMIIRNAQMEKRKWMANIVRDAERGANYYQT